MYKIPNELKQEIIKDRVIVFIGAGLSYNLYNTMGIQLKGWADFVDCLIQHLLKKGYDVAYLAQLTDRCEPIKVLDLLESNQSIPKSEILAFSKDYFDLDDEKNNYDLHIKIGNLFNKIITTNYDSAFENTNQTLKKNTAFSGRDFELQRCSDPNASVLFKIHGCYLHSDSMILFPSKYRELYENKQRESEHTLSVLRDLLHSYTLLILGSGMGDYQINSIFAEIQDFQCKYHGKYFIISKSIDSRLSFLNHIAIQDYAEINGIIDELIKVKEDNITEKQQETMQLRKQLENAQKQLDNMQTEIGNAKNDVERKDFLLNREAMKYFSNGVKFHLEGKLQKAIAEYKTCLELNATMGDAFYNWGLALDDQARTKAGSEADGLFAQACQKYEKALEIKPDKQEVLNNWGLALAAQANTKAGTESDDLFAQACQKYEMALEIKPDMHEALNNWGLALTAQARTKDGTESDDLFAQACQKYEMALEIKPNMHEALNNWGLALDDQARQKKGQAKTKLHLKALDILSRAVSLGGDVYNFACINALVGNKDTAYKYLDEALAKQQIAAEFVEKDEDWLSYKKDTEFQNILNKYR